MTQHGRPTQEPIEQLPALGPASDPATDGEPRALRYTNRCGRTSFLCEGKTGSGKIRYYVSTNLSGKLLAAMPEGYEFYEHPKDGLVVVRKKRTTMITQSERELVADRIGRLRQRHDFIIDVETHALVVYTPLEKGPDIGELIRPLAGAIPPETTQALNDLVNMHLPHGKTLRFELLDSEKRWFVVQRWCSVGPFEDWLRVDGPAPLEGLVEKFGQQLGTDRSYDLTE